MLAIHSMHRRGYCTTAVPGTSTKPTLSLPLLELNKASPPRCAQYYKAPQTPAGSRRRGFTAFRIRGAAVASDKAAQGAKLSPALWKVLRSTERAQGRDVGLGVTAHIPAPAFPPGHTPGQPLEQSVHHFSAAILDKFLLSRALVTPQAKVHQHPPFFLHSECISNKNTASIKARQLQPSRCHVTGDMRPFTDVANSS